MGTNGNGRFKEDELVSRKMKVGNEWQTRVFPIIGGRLRILHESNDQLSIQTEIVRLDHDFTVVKAIMESKKGKFNGTGTASSQRDARLADSLVELAETRAIARALRFGGIGVEYTSAEEISHISGAEPEKEQSANKETQSVFPEGNGNGKKATKTENLPYADKPKASNDAIGRATQAQCRALFALTKRAQYTDQDIESLLSPLNASTFQELSRESASQLITYLQTEVAA